MQGHAGAGSVCKRSYDLNTMSSSRPPILDRAHAEFISGAVSINAASCRPGGFPALARGLGCRVAEDCNSVNVIFGVKAAADVLDGVRRSGALAVVFSEPSTHRTLQLKGDDALVLRLEPGDAALVDHYRDGFVGVLAPYGHTEEMVRALLACSVDELVMVRFTPTSAFSQTPGPHAGEPLAGAR